VCGELGGLKRKFNTVICSGAAVDGKLCRFQELWLQAKGGVLSRFGSGFEGFSFLVR
jgi:hypothetical protein